jgi:Ca-activated chloride channel family protein
MRFVSVILLILAFNRAVGAVGLLAPDDQTLPPLRVTDHLVDVTVRDGIALTTVTQTFHNDTGQRLEATYIFPLSEGADLTNFQMTFNGKMVEGRVLPAAEAVQIYESIVRQSKDPGLIEFIGRRLLQMRVFPIEPESDTTVQVQYQQVCRPIGGLMGYHYPLHTCKATGQAYGTVRFAAEISSSMPLKNIWSPSHAVEIIRDGENDAKVEYEATGGSLNEDFLLLYDTDESDLGLSVVSWKPDEHKPGHFVAMLTPKQLWPDQSRQPQDVVFVLDTSGSMAGEKLDQAKTALRFCVDQLDERDRFSIVRFSTGYDVLGGGLMPATEDERRRGKTWIDEFSAGGGTNIADALDHVLAMAPTQEQARPFVVIFLTDGQGNRTPEEILTRLGEASEQIDDIRIFPFAVGHDVNTILLDRLAATYTGRPTYVAPGENLEIVLSDFFSIISHPVLTNLTLTLPQVNASQCFPAKLGDLYHGQQLIFVGQFQDAITGNVTLTAIRDGERVEYVWPDVSFAPAQGADYVPRLWAGRKISYLIDQIREHGETSEMVGEVVALSQAHGIQTPYTSWLVDPERHQQLLTQQQAPGTPASRGFRDGRNRSVQLELLEGLGAPLHYIEPNEKQDTYYGLSQNQVDAAVTAGIGGDATTIARANAELKVAANMDRGRTATETLLEQRIEGQSYNRIGQYLVDVRVDESTDLTVINFGSPAYFELSRQRVDLRPALATGHLVVVMVAEGTGVMVALDGGIDTFSDDQRQQLGLLSVSD